MKINYIYLNNFNLGYTHYFFVRLTTGILRQHYPYMSMDKFKFHCVPEPDTLGFTLYLDKEPNVAYSVHEKYLNVSLTHILDPEIYKFDLTKESRKYGRRMYDNRIEYIKL